MFIKYSLENLRKSFMVFHVKSIKGHKMYHTVIHFLGDQFLFGVGGSL